MHLLRTQPGGFVSDDNIADLGQTPAELVILCSGDSSLALLAEAAKIALTKGPNPARPPYWGGFRIQPLEIEFWADGAFRLHDRFRWSRADAKANWTITRLNP